MSADHRVTREPATCQRDESTCPQRQARAAELVLAAGQRDGRTVHEEPDEPVPEVRPQWRGHKREEETEPDQRVERRKGPTAELVVHLLLEHGEPGDIRRSRARTAQTNEQRRGTQRRERRADREKDARAHDGELKHRLAIDTALEREEEEHSGGGTQAQRGRERTERRAVAAESLASEHWAERDHGGTTDEADAD